MRSIAAAVLALVVAASVAACSEDPAESEPGAQSAQPSTPQPGQALPSGLPVPPNLVRAFTRVLTERARGVRDGDRSAYSGVLDGSDRRFVTQQRAYYDNLRQLPLQTFDYRLDRRSLVRSGGDYWVVVTQRLQLAGFDAAPSVTQDRFRFSAGPGGDYRLSSVTDATWEQAANVQPQPWDQTRIQVRTAPGVLGVFDDTSVAQAGPMLRSMSQALIDVASLVPYAWPQRLVFYALSSNTFLATLDDLPGGDIGHVDAVAFPVQAGPQDPSVVATRVVMTPSTLGETPKARDRLARHELVHVAVGDHDDDAPLWLSEGIAEFLSVQPLGPEDREITRAALDEAESGVDAMPSDASFNDQDASAHYALAWWACEFLVNTYGDNSLWSLLDAFDAGGAKADEITNRLFGLSAKQIARRGAKLMIQTYEPSYFAPTTVPTTPGGTATGPATPGGSGAGSGATPRTTPRATP